MPVRATWKIIRKPVRGGKRFETILRQAVKKQEESVQVGFFPNARYPTMTTTVRGRERTWNGEYVADVARRNEFGYGNVPPRPFFRQALPEMEKRMKVLGPRIVDVLDGVFSEDGLRLLGEAAVGELQESITRLNHPPNAPSTVEMKQSDNPLIDTGLMRESVSYEIT